MRDSDAVPTREDWGRLPSDDLDVTAAFRDFYGRRNEEMRSAFLSSPIEMVDCLRWMPPIPFRYYLRGFIDLLLRRQFQELDAADAAGPFLSLIEEKVRGQPSMLDPIAEQVLAAVDYVSAHQAEFYADPDIYGNFSEKGQLIRTLWGER